MPDIERWRTTWRGLGVQSPAPYLYAVVVSRYAESHRRYHTLQHLGECFAHVDEVRDMAERAHELELALWFHDAVYEVSRQDNEARSAAWAREVALERGMSISVAQRVHDLIMATTHDAMPGSPDAALLVDVDLAILGAPVDRFDEYERQVRQEYAWVPGFLFRRTRCEMLEALLARPHVYTTDHFRVRYEAAARANLARSIARLRGR